MKAYLFPRLWKLKASVNLDLDTLFTDFIFFYWSALVDKIYKAQKERDAAVLSRLRLANEERDEVLARMKRLEHEQQGSVVWLEIF